MKNKVRFYNTLQDDFEVSREQDYTLPADYCWIRKDPFSVIFSAVIYAVSVFLFFFYCKFSLHMVIHGRKKMKACREGFFIYGNHTQPVGDVFIPAICARPKRIYTVVSPANYGIPGIGKILPYLGALPLADSVHGMMEFNRAMEKRLADGHPVTIYPEAHVWEYYNGIRPFPDTSFKYPAKSGRPVFAMTTTYRKSRFFKKPVMDVFLDGPFYPKEGTLREKAADLHRTVEQTMKQHCRENHYEYIAYRCKQTEETVSSSAKQTPEE